METDYRIRWVYHTVYCRATRSCGRAKSSVFKRIDASDLRGVDCFCDSVGRPRRRLHAPIEVVGVGPGEVNTAVWLDQHWPELGELSRAIRRPLARRAPRVEGPDHDAGLFDVFGAAGVVLSVRGERTLRGARP